MTSVRHQPYTCPECSVTAKRVRRCAACAEARASARRDRRAAKRERGECTECHARAVKGRSRCRRHVADNAARSLASHLGAP